jgi:dynein heavy chain
MFMASMNPKSGSFFVDLRLQRHFTTVALILPDKDALKAMYKQILDNHFANFDQVCRDTVTCIVDATAGVFTNITMDKTLLPTATKFHYQFNLRDFSKITQTFLLTDNKTFRGNKLGLARLWLHECHRVWRDRLIRAEDDAKYMQYINTGLSQFQLKPEDCHAEPLVFTSFVSTCKGFNDATLMPVVSMEDLNSVLVDKLE